MDMPLMTRKRRYLISAAVLAACVGVAIGVLAREMLLIPQSSITKAKFNRIEKGMTLAEVENVFGESGRLFAFDNVNGRKTQIAWWIDVDAMTEIEFVDDRVAFSRFIVIGSTETFPKKLRRWLHLP
jgi:hypothetical protein